MDYVLKFSKQSVPPPQADGVGEGLPAQHTAEGRGRGEAASYAASTAAWAGVEGATSGDSGAYVLTTSGNAVNSHEESDYAQHMMLLLTHWTPYASQCIHSEHHNVDDTFLVLQHHSQLRNPSDVILAVRREVT